MSEHRLGQMSTGAFYPALVRKPMLPIPQRLKLYGFAWVQVDPARPIEPWRWGLRDLQAGPFGKNWAFLLKNCRPFSATSNLPAISPSLPWLLKLRSEQPLRPLLFCQTAFERWPGIAKIKMLPVSDSLPFLCQDDAWLPLQWATLPAQHPEWRFGFTDTGARRQFFNSVVATDPEGTFWFQEDGRIAIQPSLFSSRKNPDIWFRWPLMSKQQVAVREELLALQGAWLACASTREALVHFRQDLCRFRRGHFIFCEGLLAPFAQVRGPLMVFAMDRELRWGDMRCQGWPLLHLDGALRHQRFRLLRVGKSHMPAWFWGETVLGNAFWQWGKHRLAFQETTAGWRSCVTSESAVSGQARFGALLACFSDRVLQNAKSRLG